MLTKLLCLGLVAYASAAVKLQEVFSWNAMDWNYPNELQRQEAILSGALIRENALPVGIERWRNKLFVSVPRWRPGMSIGCFIIQIFFFFTIVLFIALKFW